MDLDGQKDFIFIKLGELFKENLTSAAAAYNGRSNGCGLQWKGKRLRPTMEGHVELESTIIELFNRKYQLRFNLQQFFILIIDIYFRILLF